MACSSYVPPPRPGSPTYTAPARQETRWLVYLATPQHDPSASESLSADPRPSWHVSVGRAVRGAPAITESVIAVGTADRQVALVDRSSGQVLWRAGLHGTIHGGPLIDGDRVYVATEASPSGRVYALGLKDGRVVWSTETGGIEAGLAIEGDSLYAGTETGHIMRLETREGKVQWQRQLAGAIRADPVPGPAGLAVITTADTLYLLDAESGAVRRRVALPGTVLAPPALSQTGIHLFAGTTAGHLLAINLIDGTFSWDVKAGDAVLAAPVLVRDTVFCLTRDGHLWLVPRDHPDSARVLPLAVVTIAGPTPLSEGAGTLVATIAGEVLLVEPRRGDILWRAELDGPIEQPPLVRGRELVVIGGRGDIHAYR
ncbi:MAG TPA: PQQ-binding-like beta-propeller repeat protein [Gemmatimonadales bacterium]|nr:PQQ-binding-like beta-propeller repeat protein [Gemmatimonadales bacterium]